MSNSNFEQGRRIVITADGSASLFLPNLDEHYHSIHGAIQESAHVFIQKGLEPFLDNEREIEILELIEQGLTNQQVASRLSLTLHTVKNHVHNLLSKLGVGSRSEAVSVFRASKFANPAS